jgi:hypothetical protein
MGAKAVDQEEDGLGGSGREFGDPSPVEDIGSEQFRHGRIITDIFRALKLPGLTAGGLLLA